MMKHYVSTLMIAAILVSVVGCRDSETSGESSDEKGERVMADAGAESDTTPQIRTAFGIPLPPEGKLEDETDYLIVWRTDMSVKELETYYKARLTDYEVLREGLTLRIVGLRSGMATAFGSHDGKEYMPVTIGFKPGTVPQTAQYLQPKELDGSDKIAGPPTPPPPTHFGGGKKGSPVTVRLPSGELMAPGARWGEPYTPPEGSFYHKRKFKANWGRPFGDWRAF